MESRKVSTFNATTITRMKHSVTAFKFFGTFAVLAIASLIGGWITRETVFMEFAGALGICAGLSILVAIIISIWES
jgi:hypothetical protein